MQRWLPEKGTLFYCISYSIQDIASGILPWLFPLPQFVYSGLPENPLIQTYTAGTFISNIQVYLRHPASPIKNPTVKYHMPSNELFWWFLLCRRRGNADIDYYHIFHNVKIQKVANSGLGLVYFYTAENPPPEKRILKSWFLSEFDEHLSITVHYQELQLNNTAALRWDAGFDI